MTNFLLEDSACRREAVSVPCTAECAAPCSLCSFPSIRGLPKKKGLGSQPASPSTVRLRPRCTDSPSLIPPALPPGILLTRPLLAFRLRHDPYDAACSLSYLAFLLSRVILDEHEQQQLSFSVVCSVFLFYTADQWQSQRGE